MKIGMIGVGKCDRDLRSQPFGYGLHMQSSRALIRAELICCRPRAQCWRIIKAAAARVRLLTHEKERGVDGF